MSLQKTFATDSKSDIESRWTDISSRCIVGDARRGKLANGTIATTGTSAATTRNDYLSNVTGGIVYQEVNAIPVIHRNGNILPVRWIKLLAVRLRRLQTQMTIL